MPTKINVSQCAIFSLCGKRQTLTITSKDGREGNEATAAASSSHAEEWEQEMVTLMNKEKIQENGNTEEFTVITLEESPDKEQLAWGSGRQGRIVGEDRKVRCQEMDWSLDGCWVVGLRRPEKKAALASTVRTLGKGVCLTEVESLFPTNMCSICLVQVTECMVGHHAWCVNMAGFACFCWTDTGFKRSGWWGSKLSRR